MVSENNAVYIVVSKMTQYDAYDCNAPGYINISVPVVLAQIRYSSFKSRFVIQLLSVYQLSVF